jgi:hypothetical protein
LQVQSCLESIGYKEKEALALAFVPPENNKMKFEIAATYCRNTELPFLVKGLSLEKLAQLSGRSPAKQVQDPEFKPQYYHKNNNKEKNTRGGWGWWWGLGGGIKENDGAGELNYGIL